MIDNSAAVQLNGNHNTILPKYLSEATRLNNFQKGKFNFVFADVGAGKTTYVGNLLPNELDYEGAYIFLSPYKSLKRQTIEDDLFEPHTEEIEHALKGFIKFEGDGNLEEFDFRGKKIIFTAQKFFWYVQKHPEVWNQIGVLVIDEVDHVLFTLPTWGKHPKDPFKKVNTTLNAHLHDTYIIGLTATNKDKLLQQWENKHNVIKFKEPLRELVPETITYFDQLYPTVNTILSEIKKSKVKSRIAIFTKLVSSAIKLKEYYIEQGYTVDVLVSDSAKNYTMTEREAAIKQSIEKTGDAEFGDILIFNSTLERGVSILNTSFSHVIVNNSNSTTQIQVLGRFRYSGIHAYYLNKKTPDKNSSVNVKSALYIPKEYLNTELTPEQTKELCTILQLKDDRGRTLGWNTTKKIIATHLYAVNQQRKYINGKKTTIYTITPTITV